VVCANRSDNDGRTRLCASCQAKEKREKETTEPYKHFPSKCKSLNKYRRLVDGFGALCDLTIEIGDEATACLWGAYEAETNGNMQHNFRWTCTNKALSKDQESAYRGSADDQEDCCCPRCALRFVDQVQALSLVRMPSMNSVREAFTLERMNASGTTGSYFDQTESAYLRSILTDPSQKVWNVWNEDKKGWDYYDDSKTHPSQIKYRLSPAAQSIEFIQYAETDFDKIMAEIMTLEPDRYSTASPPVSSTTIATVPRRSRSRSISSLPSIAEKLWQGSVLSSIVTSLSIRSRSHTRSKSAMGRLA
jgi:hypothetical protein